jgi:hypothetical protein
MFGMMSELLGELEGWFFSVREVRHHDLVRAGTFSSSNVDQQQEAPFLD